MYCLPLQITEVQRQQPTKSPYTLPNHSIQDQRPLYWDQSGTVCQDDDEGSANCEDRLFVAVQL